MKQKPVYVYKVLFLTAAVFFFLTILPLFLLAFYAHPSDNDNFLVFASLKKESHFSMAIDAFRQHQLPVRYAGAIIQNILITRLPAQLTESALRTLLIKYRILALIQICSFAASLFYLCHAFTVRIVRQSRLFLVSLFAFLFYTMLVSSPHIFHTFYEMISANGYSTGLELTFVLIGLLIDHYYTGKKNILIALIIVLVCGMLEVFPILTGCILLYPFILKRITGKKWDRSFFLFSFLIISIFLMQIFTPGQQSKLEMYGNGEWVIGKGESRTSLPQLLRYLKEFVHLTGEAVHTLLRKRNILFTAAVTTLTGTALLKRNIHIAPAAIFPYYLVIALCGFPFHYCYLSIIGLERANNLISLLISAQSLLFFTALEEAAVSFTLPVWKSLLACGKSLSAKKELQTLAADLKSYFISRKKPLIIISGTACVFLLIFLVVKPENTVSDCYEALLTGTARRYDREMTDRYSRILASDDPVVSVPPLSVHPHVLFYTDTLENGSWAALFDKEKLFFAEKEDNAAGP